MASKLKQPEKKPLLRRIFTRKRVLALAFLLLVYFGYNFYQSRTNLPEYDTYTVKSGNLVQTINASGEVRAENHADLAFVQPGEIEEIYVTNAQIVKKGDRIAKVDTSRLAQAYYQAEADLRNAQATLDRVYDQIKDDEEVESFSERETRTAAETAKDKAYRAYVIAQINLSQGIVTAPFGGIVTINDGVSEGTFGSTATKTFTLTDPYSVYIQSEVDETDVNKITSGMKALVELDAFEDEIYEQQVKYVSFTNSFNSSGGTVYNVAVSLPENENLRYRLGMNGNVHFVANTIEGVLTIPQTAVSSNNGDSFVWLLESGKVTKRTVQTGQESDEDVEIVSGLSEGDEVVLRPQNDLSEGTRIKVVEN